MYLKSGRFKYFSCSNLSLKKAFKYITTTVKDWVFVEPQDNFFHTYSLEMHDTRIDFKKTLIVSSKISNYQKMRNMIISLCPKSEFSGFFSNISPKYSTCYRVDVKYHFNSIIQ